jgi:hypothetical protein
MKILSVALLSLVASFAPEVHGTDFVNNDITSVEPLTGGRVLFAADGELGDWGTGDFYVHMDVTGTGSGDIGNMNYNGFGGKLGVLFLRTNSGRGNYPEDGPIAMLFQDGTIWFQVYRSKNKQTLFGGRVPIALPNPTDQVTRRLAFSRVGTELKIEIEGQSVGTFFAGPNKPTRNVVVNADMLVGKNFRGPPNEGRLNMLVENVCIADRKDLCEASASVIGDPHIKTWNRKMYDFHGACDLVMLSNADYNEGQGMDIHLRTKSTKQWSFVSSAAVRIGKDILEVRGAKSGSAHQYWLNGEAGKDLSLGIAGHSVSYEQENGVSSQFFIALNDNGEGIKIKTWKEFVRVDFTSPSQDTFASSLGLLGSYPSGSKFARDGKTVIDDNNAFGLEWQVLPEEAKLFHNLEGAQAPEQCVMPDVSKARRRLGESTISLEDAQLACARVTSGVDRDACVFDVLATNDRSMAGVY